MAQFESARLSPAGPQTLGSQVSANPTPIGPNVSTNPFSAVAGVVLKGASVAGRIAQSEAEKEYSRQVREQREADRIRTEADRAHSEARVTQTDLLAQTLIPMEEDAKLTGNWQPYVDKITELSQSSDLEPSVKTRLLAEHQTAVVNQATDRDRREALRAATTRGILDVNNAQLVQSYMDPASDFQKKLSELPDYVSQRDFVHTTMIEDTARAIKSVRRVDGSPNTDDDVIALLRDPAVAKNMIEAENQILAKQVSQRAEALKSEAEYSRKMAVYGAASGFMEGSIDVGRLTQIAHAAHPSLGPEELQVKVAESVGARATSLVDAADSNQIVSIVGQLQRIEQLKMQFPPGQAANSLQASLESAYSSAAIKTADYVNKQLPLGEDRDRAFIHVTPPGSTGWTTPAQQGFVAAARFFGITTPTDAKNLDELTPNGPAQKKFLDQLKRSYSDLEQGAKIDSTKTATASSQRSSFLTGHSLSPSEGFKSDPFLFATDAKSPADFLRHITDAVGQMPADVLQQVGGSRQDLIQSAVSAFGPNGVDMKNPTMRALATLAGQTTGKAVVLNSIEASTVASSISASLSADNPTKQQYAIGLLSGMGGLSSPKVQEALASPALGPADSYALSAILRDQAGLTNPILPSGDLSTRINILKTEYAQLGDMSKINIDPKRPDEFVELSRAYREPIKVALAENVGITVPALVELPSRERHTLDLYIAAGRVAKPDAKPDVLVKNAIARIQADKIKIVSDDAGIPRFIEDPAGHVPTWYPNMVLSEYPTPAEKREYADFVAKKRSQQSLDSTSRWNEYIQKRTYDPTYTDPELFAARAEVPKPQWTQLHEDAKKSQSAYHDLMLHQWMSITAEDDAAYVASFKKAIGVKDGTSIGEAIKNKSKQLNPELFSDKSVDYSNVSFRVSFAKAGDELLYPDGGGVILMSIPTKFGTFKESPISLDTSRAITFSQKIYSDALGILKKRNQ